MLLPIANLSIIILLFLLYQLYTKRILEEPLPKDYFIRFVLVAIPVILLFFNIGLAFIYPPATKYIFILAIYVIASKFLRDLFTPRRRRYSWGRKHKTFRRF